jgi:hypothetical protein
MKEKDSVGQVTYPNFQVWKFGPIFNNWWPDVQFPVENDMTGGTAGFEAVNVSLERFKKFAKLPGSISYRGPSAGVHMWRA